MFGSEVLDVALGLVLVFLLMSLVLTAVQEVIESWLRSRAGDLNRAVHELLQADDALVKRFYNHPLVFALHRATIIPPAVMPPDEAEPAATPYAAPSRADRATLPSYIPRETFAAALIDLIETGQARNSRLVESYDTLNRLSGGDLARVRAEVEGWYDGAMDRASGWFKRRTQKILFWLGLASAVLLNVNAVTVARHLATDEQARAFAAEYAEGITKSGQPTTEQIGAFQTQLQDKVGLPIGWSPSSRAKLREGYPAVGNGLRDGNMSWRATRDATLAFIGVTVGYLITAFAAMLGAPFWFDVLNRIMVIRSTVKPKEKSPDEPSEDGGGRGAKAGGGRAGGATGGGSAGGGSSGAAAGPGGGPERDRLAPATSQPIYG